MRAIVGASLQFRSLVIVLAAALLFFGMARLRESPVDVLPEFTQTFVEVQTEALGLSAEEVESLITIPLEQDLLNGVAWLHTIRSKSVPGLSSIVLIFDPGTDLVRARQMVQERLTQAFALPHVSKPPTMLQPLSSSNRVMLVGLSSKSLSLIQMSVLARWTIGPRLMGVPGVANVSIWGQRDRQLQVLVDPERLRAQNVTLLQVLETTGNALWVSSLSFVEASTPGTGGFIDTPNQRLGIRHISPIITADGLSLVPISDLKKNDGTPMRLGDVANVVEDHQPLIGNALTDEGTSLVLVIDKFPGANALEVTRAAEAALASLTPGLPGIKVDTSLFRPANFIEDSLGNLERALLLGAVLVTLVFAVFSWDWRLTLIGLTAMTLSLVGGGLVLNVRGASLNVMVLAGLVAALGLLIDDAMLDAENIARRLREWRTEGRSTASIVLEASGEMRGAVLFATLIMLVAVLPVFFVEGASGAFFQPLSLSYAAAVAVSMLIALTVTPMLCLLLLERLPGEPHTSPLVVWLQRGYGRWLAWVLRRPLGAFVAVGLLGLIGLATLPILGQSVLPDFKERELVIQVEGAPGTSQPEMSRISGLMARELREIAGVQNAGARIGRAIFGDRVVGIDSAELWVTIAPSADYERTLAAVQNALDGYAGLRTEMQTYLQGRSRGVAAAATDPVVVRVFGENLKVLRAKAEEVRQAMTTINGVVNPHINLPAEESTVEVEVDLAKAQRYGLKPGDVRRAATTLMSGVHVGDLFEQQKVFEVIVWSRPETRQSVNSIRELLVDTPGSGPVRLGDVAEVRIVSTPNIIQHEAVSRFVDVSAGLSGRSLTAIAPELNQRLKQVQFPLEYHAELLGDSAVQETAQARMFTIMAAAVILVFFLLQAAFGSWRLAAFAFLTLPTALAGGLLATLASSGILSLGALVGLLAVFGFAVRNGILLINHLQRLEQQERGSLSPEMVTRGTQERLAPILTTAFATGLALAPALFLGDVAGLEIVRPMAIVMMGGLASATLLVLFIVPACYLGLAPRATRAPAPITEAPAGGLPATGK